MHSRPAIVAILAILLVSAAGYATWNHVRSEQQHTCKACLRPVHHARTVAVADGKQAPYCCPACALSDKAQSGARVQVTSLTDHVTGLAVPAGRAWVVRGSDVNHCARQAGAEPRPDKRPMEAHYDRCSPGLIAFSEESAAVAFVREHGGHILRFAAMTAAARP